MQKTIFKTTILMLATIFICQPLQIKADGGMIPYQWDDKDIYEPSQTSLIVYDNGKEDLYLKVNYEGETNKFVWVIPTPSYPEASKAPKDIFKELSIATGEEMEEYSDKQWGDAPLAGDLNVIVHSQKNIGIYEITVLSASGADGLFDWLNNHNYKVNEEAKILLDWYVKKEWYFTAVRIDPENIIENVIDEFNEDVKIEITEYNLAEELTDYYINSILNIDYDGFQKSINYLDSLTDEEGFKEGLDISIEKFNEECLKIKEEDSLMAEIVSGKEEIQGDIQHWIDNLLNPEKVEKYSDYIEPIKISFSVNTIVYPLKISQMSTRVPEDPEESLKTNEILLYVLTDNQMMAPGFSNEYAETINAEKLVKMEEEVYDGNLEGLKEIVRDNEYFLTKIRRDFAKIEMDEDLYLINGNDYNPISEDRIESLSAIYSGNENYLKAKNKVKGSALSDRLKGMIVLKVEDNGEAYYINPKTLLKRYLGRPDDAFSVMRDQGIGITNVNLEKISIGLSNLTGADADGDGLPDMFEDAIGTDKNKADTDNDGYNDKAELDNGYNPNGSGKLNFDNSFSDSQKGRIFLQVENNGEAWYVNPNDSKKYFLGRPADAFQVMRNLGLGISNSDFEKL